MRCLNIRFSGEIWKIICKSEALKFIVVIMSAIVIFYDLIF